MSRLHHRGNLRVNKNVSFGVVRPSVIIVTITMSRMKPPSDELLFCQMHRRARVGVGRRLRGRTPFAAEGTTDGEHARNEEDRDDANADDDGGGEELIWGTAAPTRRDGRWRKRGARRRARRRRR